MNRRDTLKAALAAPFVGKIKGFEAGGLGGAGGSPGASPHNPPVYTGTAPTLMAAKISRESALARLLSDGNTVAELRSRLFAETHPSAIDPDLLILKSLSPMAKLAYQRQREVEKKLKELTSSYLNFPKQWSFAGAWLEERISKMMCG
jgi:hypothetical protein